MTGGQPFYLLAGGYQRLFKEQKTPIKNVQIRVTSKHKKQKQYFHYVKILPKLNLKKIVKSSRTDYRDFKSKLGKCCL